MLSCQRFRVSAVFPGRVRQLMRQLGWHDLPGSLSRAEEGVQILNSVAVRCGERMGADVDLIPAENMGYNLRRTCGEYEL